MLITKKDIRSYLQEIFLNKWIRRGVYGISVKMYITNCLPLHATMMVIFSAEERYRAC